MSFGKILNVLAVLALVVTAAVVYRIKYKATFEAEEIAKLQREIDREREAIAVLRAEWAALTRPDRVQAIAATHLELAPKTPQQIVAIGKLPMRPEPEDLIGKTIASLGLEVDDTIVTGSTGGKP